MTTYFLSYARADEVLALRFAGDLIAAGVSVWVDQYDIRPSQHWDRAVETALRGCQGFIVILSPRSAASPNVADEVSVAIDGGKAIIPVLVEPCILPLRMTRMQFIDATQDYDGALRRCLSAIRDAPGPGVAPTPEASFAPILPAEVLGEAERRLIGFIGPIASHLVRQAAARAATTPALYAELARSLAEPTEREAFLGWLTQPSPADRIVTPRVAAPVDLDEPGLAQIVRALTHHLGPIAAQLVKREHPLAASREDLCQRLAARIPDRKERTAFLKAVGG